MKKYPYIKNILLFLVTFATCIVAGTLWSGNDYTEITNWSHGITYAVLIMTFISAHEFGHYFAARKHKVDTTLPFYIPFLPIPYILPLTFGTFGAVIKTRSPIPSSKALFDIGAAGPIAGFIVCVIYLIYGLQTLPGIEFIYNIHPEYITKYGGNIPEISLFFGDTLIYWIFTELFTNPEGFLPPMNEIYHYPFLCVGWFGLFVTALNMLPLGQLDGGHVTYAMFGKMQRKISRVFWWFMVALGAGSLFGWIYGLLLPEPDNLLLEIVRGVTLPPLQLVKDYAPWYFSGWEGWLFWAFITKMFIKLDHPPIEIEEDIGPERKAVGWFALLILALCFSYNGIYFVE